MMQQEGSLEPRTLAEEQLFTSPLRLLLAIDGELSAIAETDAAPAGGGAAPHSMLSSGQAMRPAERQRRLLELREDVQQRWEAEAA